jgi:hypothetical protein
MQSERIQRWSLLICGGSGDGTGDPDCEHSDAGTLFFQAGACAPSLLPRRALTQYLTITARFGRMINALIAAGLARYGFKDHASRILSGLFAANLFVEYRLPELFCGFYRRDGEGPVPYPVACSPQSWSAASVFLLIQAILGMKIAAAASRLSFVRPVLPEFLDEIQIKNLKVGTGSVDLLIHRRARYATVEIERREGPVEISTET